MELTQHEKILVIMFKNYKQNNNSSKFWRASDFQKELYGIFVGYEATARMSELYKKCPSAFEVRTNERFRELRFKFEEARLIYDKLGYNLGRHLVWEGIIN
jgi:hypothetical protein